MTERERKNTIRTSERRERIKSTQREKKIKQKKIEKRNTDKCRFDIFISIEKQELRVITLRDFVIISSTNVSTSFVASFRFFRFLFI